MTDTSAQDTGAQPDTPAAPLGENAWSAHAPDSVAALSGDQIFMAAYLNAAHPAHKAAVAEMDRRQSAAVAAENGKPETKADGEPVAPQTPADLHFDPSILPPGLDNDPDLASFGKSIVFDLGGTQADMDVVVQARIAAQERLASGAEAYTAGELNHSLASVYGDDEALVMIEDAKAFVKTIPGSGGEQVRRMIQSAELEVTPSLVATMARLYRAKAGY